MAPEHIEKSVDLLFEKMAFLLSKSTEVGRLLALGFLVYVVYVLAPIQWTQNYPQWSRLYLVTDRYWLTLLIGFASYFYRWLPRAWLHATVTVGAWAASSALIGVSSPWILAYPFYILVGFGLLKCLDAHRTSLRRWAVSIALIGGFLVCMYAAGIVGTTVSAKYFQLFWTVHPEYALITLLFYCWSMPELKHAGDNPAPLILVPANISYPLPLPARSQIERTDIKKIIVLWWRGLLNVVVALGLFSLCLIVGNRELPASPGIAAVYQYFYFLIFISASMNFLTGLIRMYGVDAPPASRYVAFANSPLDVWRRGASHIYSMVLQFVFIPVMRRSRSTLVTAAACVIFISFQMFFFHEIGVRAFYSFIFPQFGTASHYVKAALLYTAAFALGWLLLVIAWQVTIERRKGSLVGPAGVWLRIVLNHVLVIALMVALSKVGSVLGSI
ncbi:MAG: hypothetical protein IPJ84_00475 [Bdellovibrionales bacterium]|nr:hypothetical protein [Bdellovibrionales bacterium]